MKINKIKISVVLIMFLFGLIVCVKAQNKSMKNEDIEYTTYLFRYIDSAGIDHEKYFLSMPQVNSINGQIKEEYFTPFIIGLKSPFINSDTTNNVFFSGLNNLETDFFCNLALYHIHNKEIPSFLIETTKYDKKIVDEWRTKYKEKDIMFWSKIYKRKKVRASGLIKKNNSSLWIIENNNKVFKMKNQKKSLVRCKKK